MSLQSLLNGLVTVQRKSSSEDASLGESATWTSDPSPILASVQPMSARERMMFLQRGVQVSHAIYFAQDPQATLRDRILDNRSGKIYRIVQSFDMAGRVRAWRLECLEMAS